MYYMFKIIKIGSLDVIDRKLTEILVAIQDSKRNIRFSYISNRCYILVVFTKVQRGMPNQCM